MGRSRIKRGGKMEKLKRYKEANLSGRKIIDTKHAIDRFVDRYNNRYSLNRIHRVIYDAMNTIIDKYHDESTTYGVWSKSTGICVIIDWRRDTMNKRDNLNHAVIVTLPPVKDEFRNFHTTNPKDIRFVVENLLHDLVVEKISLKESFKPNKLKEVKINNHSIFLHEGKMFDSGISFCIEVE